MLTLKYVKKASGLMHSYGIARPGELDHEASAFEGPATQRPNNFYAPQVKNSSAIGDNTSVELTVKMICDEVTGARKFVVF